MIYKCKNCGAVLEYSVETNRMVCTHCQNSFSVEEVSEFNKSNDDEVKIVKNSSAFQMNFQNGFASNNFGDYNTILERKQEEAEKTESREHASISMQIMKCTSCGAELAVNGVETSTFCAYCGQATVVQDRMEEYLKPDYIIPFKVTRDDAERIIRNTLNDGMFVPKAIKEFEVEKMRGIYVPFWLFDMYFHDRQFYKYSKKVGKTTVTRYEFFEGQTEFRRLTLDASKNLNDDSSQRLEPYDMRQMREFDTAFLSGYYSDRFDMGIKDMEKPAAVKAGLLFNEEARKEIKHKTASLVQSNPEYRVNGTNYALLPAWFMTFRHNNEPYTILVNGQTGKMVGAVPYQKGKVYGLFAGLSVLTCSIGTVLCTVLSKFFFVDVGFDEKITFIYAVGVPALAIILMSGAIKKYKSILKSLKLTRSKTTNKFAKERQDR